MRNFGAETMSWFAPLSGQIFTPLAAAPEDPLDPAGDGDGPGLGIPGGCAPSGMPGGLLREPGELLLEPDFAETG